jgi:hypothetical protein
MGISKHTLHGIWQYLSHIPPVHRSHDVRGVCVGAVQERQQHSGYLLGYRLFSDGYQFLPAYMGI